MLSVGVQGQVDSLKEEIVMLAGKSRVTDGHSSSEAMGATMPSQEDWGKVSWER